MMSGLANGSDTYSWAGVPFCCIRCMWDIFCTLVYLDKIKKDRCRPCRKMFLEPDVPPSQKHTLIVRDAGRQRVYAMLVSSRVMCFRIAIPSLNTSVRNARKPLPRVRKTFHYRNEPRGRLLWQPVALRKARDAQVYVIDTPILCILCLFLLRQVSIRAQ